MEKLFKLKERQTTVRTEIIAGLSTFFAIGYIVLVNPELIGSGNQALFNGVFFATCISCAIGTLLMAFIANFPFAQATGMGLSAFFTFTAMPAVAALAGGQELSLITQYQRTLPIIFMSALLLVIMTLLGIREKIINGIPNNIKLAMTSGIGLFITYLGLKNAGIIVASEASQVTLIKFSEIAENGQAIKGALLAIFGLVLIVMLSSRNVKGSILIGILATTFLSFIIGYSTMPEKISFDISKQASDFFSVSFFKMDFAGLFAGDNLATTIGSVVALTLSFFMVHMFDSLGTFVGAASAAKMVDENGEIRGMRKGLLCDSIGAVVGACTGTSTVTTVVESSAGIGEGGRTGLSSLVTAVLFLVALIFAPIIVLVPNVATAPALIYVGCLMIGGIKKVNFEDMTEAIPAFLTIIMMPLSFSIANGIAFGLVSYTLIKLLSGKIKDIKWPTLITSLLFIVYFMVV